MIEDRKEKRGMKALVALGPNEAAYLEVNKPKAEKNMVLVKVIKAGICATDFAIYTGECSFVKDGSIKYPVRFGHEWSGIVEEVGPNVKKFKPGDHVISDSGVACGACTACKKRNFANCRHIKSIGTIDTWDGCFAEYMLIPEYHLYRVPQTVSLEDAALVEPATIAYDAFTNMDMSSVETAVILGTGAIGMASAWLAKYLGVKTVIMVGRNDAKLEVGKKIGVDILINNTKTNAVERVKQLTGDRGADLTIETSGSDRMIIDAFYMTKRYGRVSLLSFYEKKVDQIPMDHVVIQCLTIRGAAGTFGYPEKLLKIMEENPIKLTPVITHQLPFEDALDAFENESKYHNEKIKILIDFM